MVWEVVYTDEFERWWDGLTEREQMTVNASVLLIQQHGPQLKRPHADVIHGSAYPT